MVVRDDIDAEPNAELVAVTGRPSPTGEVAGSPVPSLLSEFKYRFYISFAVHVAEGAAHGCKARAWAREALCARNQENWQPSIPTPGLRIWLERDC